MSQQRDEIPHIGSWQEIENILSLPTEERNDIEKLFPWFRERSTLFQHLNDETLSGVVHFADLLRVKADQVLVHQGEIGHNFYIIVRGSCAVHALKMEADPETGLFEPILPEVHSVKGNKERLRFGHELAVMGAGRCFGELSVIGNHKERTATVITEEACIFVTIDREVYSKYVPQEFAQELVRRSAFVATHPLFRTWASAYRNILAETLQFRQLKFGEKLVKQGQKVDAVYFVLEGQLTIKMNPIKHREQYPKLLEKLDPEDGLLDGQPEDEEHFDPFQEISVMERRRLRRHIGYYACEQRYRDVKVCIIGTGGVIGDIEAILDLPVYTVTAECLQELELYEIERSSFMRIIVRKNPETHDKMRRLVHDKIEFRNNLCQSNLPMFNALLTFFQKPKAKDNRERILKRYNEKHEKKKPVQASFFTRLSQGRSVSREVKVLKRPALHMKQEEEQLKTKMGLWKNAGKFAAKINIRYKKHQEGEVEQPKQYSVEEYRDLKKRMQAMGKLTKKAAN